MNNNMTEEISQPETNVITSETADLIARRNALVKELFRTNMKIHPPPPKNASKRENSPANHSTSGVSDSTEETNQSMRHINGIHLDIYEYFSIPPANINLETLKRLQYIQSWMFTKNKDIGLSLRKLHSIDRKLGGADMADEKLIKIYNWLRFGGGK